MDINFEPPIVNNIKISSSEIDVLRLDTIHSVISGNKWFKLKGHIDYIRHNKLNGLVTIGGPFSNHLHATAAAAHELGLPAVGVIRGKEYEYQLTTTLKECRHLGMHLAFVSRSDYKLKADNDWLKTWQDKYPNYHIIPEGGSGSLGQLGFEALAPFVSNVYNAICISVGSGTSLLGIRNLMHQGQCLYGFAPMKGGRYLEQELSLPENTIIDKYHFGGFGKHSAELLHFMNDFYAQYEIPTDVVYTSKMFFGINEMIVGNVWKENQKILAIHTGGLQGNSAIKEKLIY